MRCTICQRFLPKTARKGTRFCGTNCRSRAYRLRQQVGEDANPAPFVGIGGSRRLQRTTRFRKRASGPVMIPAVLEQLQQLRERAGLPLLQTDPMLAYHANLDALLMEHMATQRILATHVTDASQAARGHAARLNDPSATQVGVGVSITERGDAVVVILLGRQITEVHTLPLGGVGTSASDSPPTPRAAIEQTNLQPHETTDARGAGFRLIPRITKLKG